MFCCFSLIKYFNQMPLCYNMPVLATELRQIAHKYCIANENEMPIIRLS